MPHARTGKRGAKSKSILYMARLYGIYYKFARGGERGAKFKSILYMTRLYAMY